jgi:hypothetical protein
MVKAADHAAAVFTDRTRDPVITDRRAIARQSNVRPVKMERPTRALGVGYAPVLREIENAEPHERRSRS